jgi:aminobenzoyl-glutamate utilization protein B
VLATRIAHKGAIAGAKAFATTVAECFSNPEVVEEAKRTFKEELGGVEYKSMLPPDQKPPVELNRAMMEKFRPEMAKHYLKEQPEFT